jgi:hypothetical protein
MRRLSVEFGLHRTFKSALRRDRARLHGPLSSRDGTLFSRRVRHGDADGT